MRLALGVDGGATKTMAVLGDDTGRVLGAALSGPSNYQLVGLERAMQSIREAAEQAASAAGVSMDRIGFGMFGLAGADFPVDFENLERGLSETFPGMEFEIVNDTWVGFRAGTADNFGGVVISGTGANYAARSPDGRSITGRGMGYEWGSDGGAGSLIRHALHFAFRSHDGTGPKTRLEEAVLSVSGFASYDDLSLYMYQVAGDLARLYPKAAGIVPLIFELANAGDEVACNILENSGRAMGEIMGRMIMSLGSGQVPQDVVMVGSLFTKGTSPLLADSFRASCHRFVPFARFKYPEMEPAGGAFLMALERMGADTGGKIRQLAVETCNQVTASFRGMS